LIKCIKIRQPGTHSALSAALAKQQSEPVENGPWLAGATGHDELVRMPAIMGRLRLSRPAKNLSSGYKNRAFQQ